MKRKIAVLPTLLTLGNAVSGFAAITYASKTDHAADATHFNYYLLVSGTLILLAMVFDGLDGYVARLAKSDSQFGGQLDSLSDVISFGAAPAFLLLCMGKLYWNEQDLLRQVCRILAALYLVCAVLRLARFNVENLIETPTTKRFKGLPSPGAAGCIAALAIFRSQLHAAHRAGRTNIGHVAPGVDAVGRLAGVGADGVALLVPAPDEEPVARPARIRGRRGGDPDPGRHVPVAGVDRLFAVLGLCPANAHQVAAALGLPPPPQSSRLRANS